MGSATARLTMSVAARLTSVAARSVATRSGPPRSATTRLGHVSVLTRRLVSVMASAAGSCGVAVAAATSALVVTTGCGPTFVALLAVATASKQANTRTSRHYNRIN